MNLTKEQLLVGARSVAIWPVAKKHLAYMADRSGVDAADLLAQAIRDGMTEYKSAAGYARMLRYQGSWVDRVEERGKAVTTSADLSPAELSLMRELVTSSDIDESTFTSYCVDTYFEGWAPRFNKDQAEQQMKKANE